jgi:hypothetical protein
MYNRVNEGAIEGINKNANATIDMTGHPYSNGDRLFVEGITGMVEMNNMWVVVEGAGADDFQTGIDSTDFTAWVSGGTTSELRGQNCWDAGSTDEPASGDVIFTLETGGASSKDMGSGADACSPYGVSVAVGGNGAWSSTLCVYQTYTSLYGEWRQMDHANGILAGMASYPHYSGVYPSQNYSDATAVIFTRAWDLADGGPLTNGGVVIACTEDGQFGTVNDCDALGVLDNEGDVQFLVETTTSAGEARVTTRGTLTANTLVIYTNGATDSPSADEMRGTMHVCNNAGCDYTLPEITTIGTGANACFYDFNGGGVVVLDAATGDHIWLNGADNGDAQAIDSAGDIGDYICIMAISNDNWVTLDQDGVWVPGGAD